MRLRLLAALLAATVLVLLSLSFPWAWIPYPVECSSPPPKWMGELTRLSKELRYPGVQISYFDKGIQIDCAAGWAEIGLWPKQMRVDDRLPYASLSKVFTSIVATQLADEGLDYESSVAEWLLSGEATDVRIREITVGHLLRHTAGFDRTLTPDPMLAPQPWCPHSLQVLQVVQLDFRPGERYAYSNLGYCMLGAVIEKYQQRSLDEIFRKRIFVPAGARSPALIESIESLGPRLSLFYGGGEGRADFQRFRFSAMHATGAWSGTAGDFLKVLNAAFDAEEGLLSREGRLDLLAMPEGCEVGRWRSCHGTGFYQYREGDGPAMYWRDGSMPGVTAFAAVLDNEKKIVFLANRRQLNWMPDNDRLGRAIYRWLSLGFACSPDDAASAGNRAASSVLEHQRPWSILMSSRI